MSRREQRWLERERERSIRHSKPEHRVLQVPDFKIPPEIMVRMLRSTVGFSEPDPSPSLVIVAHVNGMREHFDRAWLMAKLAKPELLVFTPQLDHTVKVEGPPEHLAFFRKLITAPKDA